MFGTFFSRSQILLVKPWSQGWLIAAGAYPGFCSMKRLEVFLLPLDGMLVHRRSLPRNFVRFPQQITGTHLYTLVERGTVRVKCLAQEHNTLTPARARTWTARSGVERTNYETNTCATFYFLIRMILLVKCEFSVIAQPWVPEALAGLPLVLCGGVSPLKLGLAKKTLFNER